MACNNCDNDLLKNCDDCNYLLDTDCVNFTGDRLDAESSSIKNGSSRTLTSIIEALDSVSDCRERTSKLVTDDYTIVAGDECKILLLDGDIPTAANYSYTLTLPTGSDWQDKVIVIKDISDMGSPSGEVQWSFASAIKYDWQTDATSTDFNTLADSMHRVLVLAYLKDETESYQWMVLSSNAVPLIERTELLDADLSNNWAVALSSTVAIIKEGNKVTLEGFIDSGTSSTFYTLPAALRPAQDMIFPSVYYSGPPAIAVINVLSTGQLQVASPVGFPLANEISLFGISWYIN